jgi:hypothetical protein
VVSPHLNEKVQQPVSGILMMEGLEGPEVTASTVRLARRAKPFREAEISRSADPVCCHELHRILFA